jgi:hypothetical protein
MDAAIAVMQMTGKHNCHVPQKGVREPEGSCAMFPFKFI